MSSPARPWIVLGVCVVTSVLAQVFFKLAVDGLHGVRPGVEPLPVLVGRMARSPWIWAGLVSYAAGMLFWFAVLSEFTFHEAILYFSANNLVLLVFAVTLFGETMGPRRWLGALFVVVGLLLIKQGSR